MSPRTRLFLAIALVLLASLSCEYLPGFPSDPNPGDGDAIATAVAATLGAGEGDAGPDAAPAATDTPEPVLMPPVSLKLVYERDGNLYYWDGSLPTIPIAAVGDARDVRVSDDGSVAAFTRGPDYSKVELWAVNTDGTGLRQLVDQATLSSYVTREYALNARIYMFEFIPGTHKVAFNTQQLFEAPGLFLNQDLRVVDADTSVLTTVLGPGSGGDFYYSPDGSRVGLSTPTRISRVNSDGTGRIDLLSFPTILTYSEYQYSPPLSWTPDGAAIRAAIPPEESLAPAPDPTRIWHLPTDGSAAVELMSLSPVPFFQQAVVLSADTSRAAYLVEITPGSPPLVELHVSGADGTGDMIYATGPLRFRGWAPDGVHFAYTDASGSLMIGEYGHAPASYVGVSNLIGVEWADPTRFFYQEKTDPDFKLWLGELGSPPVLIDSTPGGQIRYDHNY